MTETLPRARALAGYDEVSGIRQAADHDWLLSLAPAAPRRIADLGCGTGALLDQALRRWPRIEYALGVDGAPGRVLDARARLGTRATIREGDLRRLDGESGAFDLVVMSSVLHWLYPDEDRALAWIAGHLTPGGAFLLTTHHPDLREDGLGGEDLLAAEALDLLGLDAGALREIVPMGARARSATAVRELLSRRFTVERHEERRVAVRTRDADEWRRFHASTWGTYFSRLAPASRQEEFFRAVGAAAERRMARQGEVYPITVRAWRCAPPQ
ncbi:hypothetical protein Ssi03_38700 [Sphaerisporangium siamense]|uniref:SAM-dependent methyltransferase n=1 Tax=Sphaerisporangium siamense TaxID=795645 RepID=A0A7W7G9Z3_9ACTN|nr:methyltransferase domain-containing protein [Sphaerisporangium siamense]MBB4700974.1 SAM-dependent methyltransferase [Sphaerisporangium siamense]GII85880.1 hypothetical protein Ssi03_38700 [Sphaerisporangium siamense]